VVGQDLVPGGEHREVERRVVDPGELRRIDDGRDRRRQLADEAHPDAQARRACVLGALDHLGVTELRERGSRGEEVGIEQHVLHVGRCGNERLRE